MLKIYPKETQAKGSFNFGRILEHKPIGFPQDGGELKPYSTLFYWAHAWSDEGGLIDQHPHKGFEIMSYVLKGEIHHYDNKLNGWKKLKTGDVQVIRAGNGIVHAEKLMENSAMFQIWFDPDLSKTLSVPASYDDYPAEQFPITEMQGATIKHIKGGRSPFRISAKVDFIQAWTLKKEATFDLDTRCIYSVAVISGNLLADDQKLSAGDFLIISGAAQISLKPETQPTTLFVISTPADPGFQTYYEYMKR